MSRRTSAAWRARHRGDATASIFRPGFTPAVASYLAVMAPFADKPAPRTDGEASLDADFEPFVDVDAGKACLRIAVARMRGGATFAALTIEGASTALLGEGSITRLIGALTRLRHKLETARDARGGA